MRYQDFEMNCREFSQIVAELARERMMDAMARADGLAHAAVCARCAMRLDDERSLTAGLRAVAALNETATSPAHIETALRAVFREQQSVVSEQKKVVSLPSRWYWWAAAAAVLLLFALTAARMMGTASNHQPSKEERAGQQQIPQTPKEERKISDSEEEKIEPEPDDRQPQPVFYAQHNRKPRVHPRSNHQPGSRQNDAEEIYSDFILLTEGLAAAPLESGHLMRVRMPRSALTSFGLPVNMERAGESINAEVLMSDDGMARAIRFASRVPKPTLARY
jgi:hypothetical protein